MSHSGGCDDFRRVKPWQSIEAIKANMEFLIKPVYSRTLEAVKEDTRGIGDHKRAKPAFDVDRISAIYSSSRHKKRGRGSKHL